MSTTETTATLEQLMVMALDARREVADLERQLSGARARSREIEQELRTHPDLDEDRYYLDGHVFEWPAVGPIQIWPCRYVPAHGETRDFA